MQVPNHFYRYILIILLKRNVQLATGKGTLQLESGQKVVLLVGPSGSGKGSIGTRIAENSDWSHVSEDDVWNEIKHPPHELRTPEGQERVQDISVKHVERELRSGKSVIFEFLVFDNPPLSILKYQKMLQDSSIPFETRVLRPSVECILNRQEERGRSTERDREKQSRNAKHQLVCLHDEIIEPSWIVDPTGLSLEDTYLNYFAKFIESD